MYRRWSDQDRIDLEGAKEIPTEESEREDDKCGAGAAHEETPGLN